MPTYLCHGFRWHRQNIRVFVGKYDLQEASPEWIIAPASTSAIVHQIYELFDFVPELDSSEAHGAAAAEGSSKGKTFSAVELFEEHDPLETVEATTPYAYVADYAVRVDLSASLTEEMARYEETVAKVKAPGGTQSGDGRPWFERLRDEMETNEKIQWYVVVCGDEERAVTDEHEESDSVRGKTHFRSLLSNFKSNITAKKSPNVKHS